MQITTTDNGNGSVTFGIYPGSYIAPPGPYDPDTFFKTYAKGAIKYTQSGAAGTLTITDDANVLICQGQASTFLDGSFVAFATIADYLAAYSSFFFDVNPATPAIYDLQISALATALDFSDVPEDADVVRVSLALGQNPAAPTTVNLSRVNNMAEGKEYHVYPVPGLSLTLGQTLRVAVAAADVFVKSGIGSVTLSGNNGGFAHLRKSEIYNTQVWSVTLIELSVAGVS